MYHPWFHWTMWGFPLEKIPWSSGCACKRACLVAFVICSVNEKKCFESLTAKWSSKFKEYSNLNSENFFEWADEVWEKGTHAYYHYSIPITIIIVTTVVIIIIIIIRRRSLLITNDKLYWQAKVFDSQQILQLVKTTEELIKTTVPLAATQV